MTQCPVYPFFHTFHTSTKNGEVVVEPCPYRGPNPPAPPMPPRKKQNKGRPR